MKYVLNEREARVIGCMLEKEVTTPDQYPLSLNALTLACNQKTSREPVMSLSESEVQETLDALQKKHLVRPSSGTGSRVAKYVHRFCNTEFGDLKLTPAELAIVCLLMLRGAQTPGELRTRSNRLFEFSDMEEVEKTLEGLTEREDGPFIVRLAREPGKRELRYAHLFSGEVDNVSAAGAAPCDVEYSSSLSERVEALEEEVAQLKQLVNTLKATLDELIG
ncbi:UPF0502 protein [Leminorella grimontii]|uniref:UPF0502 protein n=1 Tax=Leminorella grimontii TaxID=82981 RepID=A0AAV5MZI9_9GAMM|nr:DUF480 domain-containing protein [Leminorella grimontii]KFC95929.1 YceH family protein [Leminorella grimontii ATCC 33999 = DSM 5078]GKX54892.1 UPF0502 protein [Leminorella grimontii]VFS58193.1 G20.3 [Leminorella grimontii]